MVFPHNSQKIRVRIMSRGERQPSDKLVYFESKSAKANGTELAHLDFDFHNNNKFITCVEISINVSMSSGTRYQSH